MKFKAVAIDGPAGAGKSTIARAIANSIQFIYVDTGALYRAIGLYVSSKGLDTTNTADVSSVLKQIDVQLKYVNNEQRVFLNGDDVSEKIRLPEMSMYASNVSAIPCVREFLFDLQRNIGMSHNIIMDGRDIGTVVLPDADVKIFLTASPEVRANRRLAEFEARGQKMDYDILLKEIKQRDLNDSTRAIAPLKQADDAIKVDTSSMTLNESIECIRGIIVEKLEITGV